MAGNVKNYQNYGDIKQRLDEIVTSVEDENVSLDDALEMYDEAVKLAMRASELVEIDAPVQVGEEAAEAIEGSSAALAASAASNVSA